MWKENHETKRLKKHCGIKFLSIAIVTLLLVITFACAWELPAIYSYYCDKKAQNQEVHQTMEVEAYSYQYATMEEKIEELSYFENNGTELARIQLPEGVIEQPENSKLRELLQKELDKMTELNILPDSIDMECYELSILEEYRIYPVSSEQFKGEISYWSMTFVDKTTAITACMDTEFHLLYSLDINGDLAGKSVESLVLQYAVDEKQKPGEKLIFEKVKQASENLAINEKKYYEIDGGRVVSCKDLELYDSDLQAESVKEEAAYQSDLYSESKSDLISENYRDELSVVASDIISSIKYGTDLKEQFYIPGYIDMENENLVSVYVYMKPDSLRIGLGCF